MEILNETYDYSRDKNRYYGYFSLESIRNARLIVCNLPIYLGRFGQTTIVTSDGAIVKIDTPTRLNDGHIDMMRRSKEYIIKIEV